MCICYLCLGSGEEGGTRCTDSRLDSPRSGDEGAQWLSLQRKEASVLEGGEASPSMSRKGCSPAT